MKLFPGIAVRTVLSRKLLRDDYLQLFAENVYYESGECYLPNYSS